VETEEEGIGMSLRRFEEKIAKAFMFLSIILVLGSLAAIIIVVVQKGISALSISLLIQTPKGGYYLGKEGGIANAIVGSLYLSLGALFFSFILGLPIAFGLQREFTRKRLGHITRLTLDVLWGMPSIVYGAFGFIVMMYLGLRASLLGGIITLTLLMLPIMIRALEEVVRMVPKELKEVSFSLGATKLETTLRVVFRQVFPGIITASMLAFGRGIGDAASILFTAGYTDYIPKSLSDPAASLPLAVFFQIGTPIPEVQHRAYASALVLLFIVLLASIASMYLKRITSKYTVK
jgi:phosphate transport system permease protein